MISPLSLGNASDNSDICLVIVDRVPIWLPHVCCLHLFVLCCAYGAVGVTTSDKYTARASPDKVDGLQCHDLASFRMVIRHFEEVPRITYIFVPKLKTHISFVV